MKLTDLILHTSTWLGIPYTQVRTVAHELRAASLISSGGRGTGGAEMTVDDKINLLLGSCGVEVAKRATDHVRVWRRLERSGSKNDDPFAFTKSATVKDFFVDLITKDLNGGPLDAWLKETSDEFDREQGRRALPRHHITLDFFIDEFKFTILVARNRVYPNQRTEADSIEVTFFQPMPTPALGFISGLRDQGYKAGSKLIRRLDAQNIRGWGTCLTDEPS